MLQSIGSQKVRYDLAAERQQHLLCMVEMLCNNGLPCKPLNSTFSDVTWVIDISLGGSTHVAHTAATSIRSDGERCDAGGHGVEHILLVLSRGTGGRRKGEQQEKYVIVTFHAS